MANNVYDTIPCPFCGYTKVKIECKKSNNFRYKDGKREDNYNVTARCNRCHARGPANSVWLNYYNSNKAIDILKDKALESWESRYFA